MANLISHFLSQPDVLSRAHQAGHAAQQVLLLVAMEQEVAFEAVQLRFLRSVFGVLDARLFIVQQYCGWERRLDDKGFSWTHDASVDIFTGELPTHPVWMEVVSVRVDIEVEDIPTDALSHASDDSGRVSHKGAAIDAEGRDGRAFVISVQRSQLGDKSQIQRPEFPEKSHVQRPGFRCGTRRRVFARHPVEEDWHVIRRNVIARQGETHVEKLFDEVFMVLEKLLAFRFEPFEMDLRFQNEGAGIFVEVNLGFLREKAPALTSFHVGIDAGDHSLAELEATGRLVTGPKYDEPAEQPLINS